MTMEKKIQDFIHFYLGCECIHSCDAAPFKFIGIDKNGKPILDGDWSGGTHPQTAQPGWLEWEDLKILLRPLSNMTEKEALGLATLKVQPMRVLKILEISNDGVQFEYESFEMDREMYLFPDQLSPTMFRLLLKNRFDLFGLIDAGLAIDKTKLPEPPKP